MAERYSDRKIPLDLADEVIATSDPNTLNLALSKLDDRGWNTDGKIWATSYIR